MLPTLRDSELFPLCVYVFHLPVSFFMWGFFRVVCRTPLMLAVAGGHVDVVSLLLEREASVNVTNKHGFTALHLGVTVQLQEILILGQNILNAFRATIAIIFGFG